MSKVSTSFSGHDKFDCKVDWIIKGLEAFERDKNILSLSNVEKGIETLGLGINMIKSLNYWMKVLGLIEKDDLSTLGKLILEKDQYLENENTLWVLHWNLVKSREKTTLYNLFFNKVYQYRFTKDTILQEVSKWLKVNNINLPSDNTLKSDIDVFLRMYSNNSFSEKTLGLFTDLNIIIKAKENYILNINSSSKVTDEVFIYIVNDYMNLRGKESDNTLSIDDIQRGDLSIQRSLVMSENTLFSKINKLESLTNNKWSYSEAQGMRSIYMNDKLDSLELLNNLMN